MPLVPMCGHVVAMFVAVWLLIAAAVPGVAAGGPLRARGGRLEFEFRTPLAGRRHAMPKIPGAAPDPAPHPPGLTVAEARAPVHSVVPAEGTARCDWRYEHARRSGVTNNFVLMQNMVQATWMFIVCAFPFAIQHPSLRYRFMGGACRMFAGATTGVVLLGGGQQLLQSSISTIVGLPDCWKAAAVPLAAVCARASTGLLADALFAGPFNLPAPPGSAAGFAGGTLLNLMFLGAGLHHFSSHRVTATAPEGCETLAREPRVPAAAREEAVMGVDGQSTGPPGTGVGENLGGDGTALAVASRLRSASDAPPIRCTKYVRRFGPSLSA